MHRAGIRSSTRAIPTPSMQSQTVNQVDKINNKLRHVKVAVETLSQQLGPVSLLSSGQIPAIDVNVLANILVGLSEQNLPALSDFGSVSAEVASTKNGNHKMRIHFRPPIGPLADAQTLTYEVNPKRASQGLVMRHTFLGKVIGKEFYRGPQSADQRHNARLKVKHQHAFQHYEVRKATYELNPRSGQMELLKANATLPDGTIEDGIFEADPVTGKSLLVKGKRTLPSGQIQSGNFTRNRHLNIASIYYGEVQTNSAIDKSRMTGIFSTDLFNNPHLADGQIHDLDGKLKSDGKHAYLPSYGKNFLIEGQQIWPDGSVTQGQHEVFRDHNWHPSQKLIAGKKFGPDGHLEQSGTWKYANTLSGELVLSSFTPRSVFSESQLDRVNAKIAELDQLARELLNHPQISRRFDLGLLDQISALFNNASLAFNPTDLENRLNLTKTRIKTICTKMTIVSHPDHTPDINTEDSQRFRQAIQAIKADLMGEIDGLNRMGQSGILFFRAPKVPG